MKGKSWALLITLAILAAAVLVPMLRNDEYLPIFCDSFSDINGLPFRKNFCAVLERAHVCQDAFGNRVPFPEGRVPFRCSVYAK